MKPTIELIIDYVSYFFRRKNLVKIRGHHLERLRVFYEDGNLDKYHLLEGDHGYSEEFCEGEVNLFNMIVDSPELNIKIITSLDDLCYYCNKDPKKEGCLDEELIEDDNSVALSYVLKIGQIYTAKEILKKFDESIRLNSLKP